MTESKNTNAHIRPVFLEPHLKEALEAFADKNGMSFSEAMREAMSSFVTGDYPQRKKALVRTSIWIDPKEYNAFAKKARESGVTIQYALALAMEERTR